MWKFTTRRAAVSRKILPPPCFKHATLGNWNQWRMHNKVAYDKGFRSISTRGYLDGLTKCSLLSHRKLLPNLKFVVVLVIFVFLAPNFAFAVSHARGFRWHSIIIRLWTPRFMWTRFWSVFALLFVFLSRCWCFLLCFPFYCCLSQEFAFQDSDVVHSLIFLNLNNDKKTNWSSFSFVS